MSALADRLEAVDPLLLAQVAAMLRDPTKDKAYQLFPLGQEAAEFLRIKRKRLTPASERAYEAALAQLALYFPTLELRDLELPAGVGLLERFMDDTWGDRAPRTYNKNLSFVSEFFKFQVIRAKMRGNPCDPIEPAKTRHARSDDLLRGSATRDRRRGREPARPRRPSTPVRLRTAPGLAAGGPVQTLRPSAQTPHDLLQGREGA